MTRSLRTVVFTSAVVSAALAALVSSGCGGRGLPLVEVTGTITDRGKPVANASVTLQPSEGPVATGTTDEQGKFTLNTGGRSGAVPGLAKVAITAVEAVPARPSADEDPEGYTEFRSLIPQKYSLIASTPLEIEVSRSEANHFEWNLTD